MSSSNCEEEDVFPITEVENAAGGNSSLEVVAVNPTYGVPWRGGGSDTSGSSDYLSVSNMNPTYQFIPSSHPRSQGGLSELSLLESSGIPIPPGSNRRHSPPLQPSTAPPSSILGTSVPFLQSYSSSAPAEGLPPLSTSSFIHETAAGSENQYSYARHVRLATSNGYVVTLPVNQRPNRIAEEESELDSGKGSTQSSTAFSSSSRRNHFESHHHHSSSNATSKPQIDNGTLKLDIILGSFSLLTIFLAMIVISLCIMMYIKDTEPNSFQTNNILYIDYSTDTPVPTPPTASPTTTTISNSSGCNCSFQFPDSTRNKITFLLNKLLDIKRQMTQLRDTEEVLINVTHQRLNDLLLKVKSINDSIQQLRPQTNYRQPQLTGLNLPANIMINHSDCVNEVYVCTLSSPFGFILQTCDATTNKYANETHIVLLTMCSIMSSSSTNLTTTLQVHPRQDEPISSSDKALEILMKSELICRCFDYNLGVSSKCYNLVKRCSYQRTNLTASVHS